MKLWTNGTFLIVTSTSLIFAICSCSFKPQHTSNNLSNPTNARISSSKEVAKKLRATVKDQTTSYGKHKKRGEVLEHSPPAVEDHPSPGTSQPPPGIQNNAH